MFDHYISAKDAQGTCVLINPAWIFNLRSSMTNSQYLKRIMISFGPSDAKGEACLAWTDDCRAIAAMQNATR